MIGSSKGFSKIGTPWNWQYRQRGLIFTIELFPFEKSDLRSHGRGSFRPPPIDVLLFPTNFSSIHTRITAAGAWNEQGKTNWNCQNAIMISNYYNSVPSVAANKITLQSVGVLGVLIELWTVGCLFEFKCHCLPIRRLARGPLGADNFNRRLRMSLFCAKINARNIAVAGMPDALFMFFISLDVSGIRRDSRRWRPRFVWRMYSLIILLWTFAYFR